jgi:zinc protease
MNIEKFKQPINKNAKLVYDNNLFKGKLNNGLTYYLYNNSSAGNNIRMSLIIKVGSLMENNNQKGIAHFTEHMSIYNELYFIEKNTKKAYDLFEGHTNFNETTYYLKCYKIEISQRLNNLKNILEGINLHEASIKHVRNQLINEIKSQRKRIQFKVMKSVVPYITRNSIGLNDFPIGQISYIKKIHYNSIIKFRNRWYNPKNASIIICGNIDIISIKKLISDIFGVISGGYSYTQIKKITPNTYKNNVFFNISKNIKGYELQIYLPKMYKISKTISDFYKYTIEYFLLKFCEYYIDKSLKNKNINCDYINFTFERLTNKFNFNIFRIKFHDNNCEYLLNVLNILRNIAIYGVERKYFEKYKKIFTDRIENQHNELRLINNKICVDECINNFLYNDPVLSLEDEYKLTIHAIKLTGYKIFNHEIRKLVGNTNIDFVVNGQADLNIKIFRNYIKQFNLKIHRPGVFYNVLFIFSVAGLMLYKLIQLNWTS